jgi:hypothetical protein
MALTEGLMPPTSNDDSLVNGTSASIVECSDAMAPRAYQIEMYEESLRRNIIVAVRHHYTLGIVHD